MRRPARADPRTAATRVALIETAETLFAQSGIDGVSLREIGAAIGSANTNVVAYHFGGKDELVLAVFMHRLPTIDARRIELLEAAEKAGRKPDLGTLVDIMFRPFFEQTNSAGRHSYAAFLDGVFRANRVNLRALLSPQFATSTLVAERIAEACHSPFDENFSARLQMCVSMVSAATQIADQRAYGPARTERLRQDTLAMAQAALSAGAIHKRGKAKS